MIPRLRDSLLDFSVLRRSFFVFLTFAVIFGRISPARADANSAPEFVAALINGVCRPTPQPEMTTPDLATRLSHFVDIDHMAQTAIDSRWDFLDERTRERYLQAYRDLIRRITEKLCAKKDVTEELLGVRHEREIDIVAFRLHSSGGDHDFYWYVRTVPRFSVVDIAIDGVLVTDRLRREFEIVLKTHAGDLTALPAAIDRLRP